MNAAARDIDQTTFFHGQLINLRISFSNIFQIGFMIVFLLSALAVIYSTNSHRLVLSRIESLQQQANHLHCVWGQLLLEQASLATPSRVELLATQQLNMHLPNNKNTVVLHKK